MVDSSILVSGTSFAPKKVKSASRSVRWLGNRPGPALQSRAGRAAGSAVKPRGDLADSVSLSLCSSEGGQLERVLENRCRKPPETGFGP
jgi:hypothetical protein